ncbi:hypothetical protein K0M31_018034 [Melipona bicolor]|uniref:Uncharacterized protein n=1 Tax=Melipona bicolor TaxID=60889 RepID=A0AA40KDZ4_9HYME|nr:hypothetical protein K0M31_018034 [Melipona bicolor]
MEKRSGRKRNNGGKKRGEGVVYAVTVVVVVENSVTEGGRKRKRVLVFRETDRSERREEAGGWRKTDEGSYESTGLTQTCANFIVLGSSSRQITNYFIQLLKVYGGKQVERNLTNESKCEDSECFRLVVSSVVVRFSVTGIVDVLEEECKEAHTDANVQRRSADVVGVGDGIGGGGGSGGGGGGGGGG